MKYLLSSLILLAAAPSLSAQSREAERDRPRFDRPPARQQDGESRRRPSREGADRAELRERLMKRFDANGDGRLDEHERAALRQAMEERRQQADGEGRRRPPRGEAGEGRRRPPRGEAGEGRRRPPRGEAGEGQGRPPRGERGEGPSPEMRERLMKRFDANGDGRLDEKERAALRAAVEQHRAQGGERRQGLERGESRQDIERPRRRVPRD